MKELDKEGAEEEGGIYDETITKPSLRITSLGRAFKNYRRTILHHLKLWRFWKGVFWGWRRCCANCIGQASFEEQVWTDDNMEAFLKSKVPFEAQLKSRDVLRKQRANPEHLDHGKPLPRLIPASLCKLWQICIAQAHGDFFQQHFGDMSVHRLARTPLAILANERDLDIGEEQVHISKVQARLFDQDWLNSLDSLTVSLDLQEPIMSKLRHFKGVGFWKYTLEMTDDLRPHFRGVRSHLSRNVFEQISARVFMESFERGPFEQEAGSASDGTVVQRVDEAPAETPAEKPAPAPAPAPVPKPQSATQPAPEPTQPAPAPAVASLPAPPAPPASLPAPPAPPAYLRQQLQPAQPAASAPAPAKAPPAPDTAPPAPAQAPQPVHSVAASAARPSSSPSPGNALTRTRAIRTEAQTSGDIRDHFDIKTDKEWLDVAVADLNRRPSLADPVLVGREIYQEVVTTTKSALLNSVAASATKVAGCIQDYSDWRVQHVVVPFLRYCTEVTASDKPVSIGTFGSTHYGLPLPTSDIDAVIITAAGRNGLQMLERLREDAAQRAKQYSDGGCFSAVERTIPKQTHTLQLKYRSLWIDVVSVPISRASERSVAATDLLKLMLEQRWRRTGLAQSILVFKLLMHHLEVIQWHKYTRGMKFKAISISYFALAVLDQMPELDQSMDASAIGINLLVLITTFARFPFRELQVNISKDGSTRIVPKTLSADVVVFVGAQDSNSAFNVRHEHVDACQKKSEESRKIATRADCQDWWRELFKSRTSNVARLMSSNVAHMTSQLHRQLHRQLHSQVQCHFQPSLQPCLYHHHHHQDRQLQLQSQIWHQDHHHQELQSHQDHHHQDHQDHHHHR